MNRYFSYLSLLSEASPGIKEEIRTSSRSIMQRSTRGENIKRKSNRCFKCFLAKGVSCSYADESIGDIEILLRYKYLVKRWVPNDIPQINTDFCVNERIYCIAPSSLHGLGLFSMDGIKVCDNRLTEFMEYVRPCCNYIDWIYLVQYTKNM